MFEAIIDDKRFFKRLRSGNAKAFELLWKEGAKNVIPFLRSGEFDHAEDLWQDCWLHLASTRCSEYKPTACQFSAWLLSVAKNRARDRERKKRRWKTVPIEVIENTLMFSIASAFDDENKSGYQENAELLEQTLETLKQSDRELLWLRFDLGLKSPAIAETLGATSVAIRQRLSRILRRLKKEIESQKDELRRPHKQPAGADSS
ncbi:MAG TPA: sigma-70 family RNA polymerase sigma factor [Pyrinomonadaceae bacterium]|nr:sigma-70 family RNA polymerase sigma factor [Pyrinomonadaceae bacterium]